MDGKAAVCFEFFAVIVGYYCYLALVGSVRVCGYVGGYLP